MTAARPSFERSIELRAAVVRARRQAPVIPRLSTYPLFACNARPPEVGHIVVKENPVDIVSPCSPCARESDIRLSICHLFPLVLRRSVPCSNASTVSFYVSSQPCINSSCGRYGSCTLVSSRDLSMGACKCKWGECTAVCVLKVIIPNRSCVFLTE